MRNFEDIDPVLFLLCKNIKNTDEDRCFLFTWRLKQDSNL